MSLILFIQIFHLGGNILAFLFPYFLTFSLLSLCPLSRSSNLVVFDFTLLSWFVVVVETGVSHTGLVLNSHSVQQGLENEGG